jgi:hypothetical protein
VGPDGVSTERDTHTTSNGVMRGQERGGVGEGSLQNKEPDCKNTSAPCRILPIQHQRPESHTAPQSGTYSVRCAGNLKYGSLQRDATKPSGEVSTGIIGTHGEKPA